MIYNYICKMPLLLVYLFQPLGGSYKTWSGVGGSTMTLSCKHHNGTVISIDLHQTFIGQKTSLFEEVKCKVYAKDFDRGHLSELLACNGTVNCAVTSQADSMHCVLVWYSNYEEIAYWCVTSGSSAPPDAPSYNSSDTWPTRNNTQTTENNNTSITNSSEVTTTSEVVSVGASDIGTTTGDFVSAEANSKETGTKAIVAGTVSCGSLAVVSLAVGAFIYYRRKKRQIPPPGNVEFQPSQSREGESRYVEFPLKSQTVNGPKTVEKGESKVTALGDDVAVVYHNSGKCGDAPSGTQQMASQGESDVDDDDMILTENDLYETRDYEGGSETADPAAASAAEEDEADNDMILTDNDLYEAS